MLYHNTIPPATPTLHRQTQLARPTDGHRQQLPRWHDRCIQKGRCRRDIGRYGGGLAAEALQEIFRRGARRRRASCVRSTVEVIATCDQPGGLGGQRSAKRKKRGKDGCQKLRPRAALCEAGSNPPGPPRAPGPLRVIGVVSSSSLGCAVPIGSALFRPPPASVAAPAA